MTGIKQRDELQSTIWKIANEVRGAVDGWDFKQFVLGTLFYRFISENFTSYIEGGDDSIHYADMSDDVITTEIKDDAIKTKGYFIYPSQLFVNIAKSAYTNPNLNTDLAAIFDAIEGSANGYPSEHDIKGLFADFDTTSNRLGNTVEEKNKRLAAVIKGVESLDFGNFEDNEIDLFGDAYEFLISNYAANAGKSGGEFFTPQNVSKLIAQLALSGQTSVNKIYDPACGSGSLLLQAKKQFDAHLIEEGFFGQEINHTTYNLARMNMFLHNINYDKFDIALGDTLIKPHYGDEKPFDAIVSNPPYLPVGLYQGCIYRLDSFVAPFAQSLSNGFNKFLIGRLSDSLVYFAIHGLPLYFSYNGINIGTQCINAFHRPGNICIQLNNINYFAFVFCFHIRTYREVVTVFFYFTVIYRCRNIFHRFLFIE